MKKIIVSLACLLTQACAWNSTMGENERTLLVSFLNDMVFTFN